MAVLDALDEGRDEPDDLALWGLHCFCLGARQTPQRIVRADGNGQLLYRARAGVSYTELARDGVTCLESRIALLKAYGLIKRDGELVTTNFPVLGRLQTSALRIRSRRLAASVMHELLSPIGVVDDEAEVDRGKATQLRHRLRSWP